MKIIYGAGMTGKSILKNLQTTSSSHSAGEEHILFTDSDQKLWGTKVENILVISPTEIKNYDYEEIIIGAAMGKEAIFKYLTQELNVEESKINSNSEYVESYFKCYETRAKFIKCFSDIANECHVEGAIAEGGVFEGRFSKILSETFPDRKLYLFDTFEGFDARDVAYDQKNDYSSNIREGLYTPTKTINEIVNSLAHPENAIIKKGYFPETAKDVDDSFAFVNLDFDLYKPTIDGLRFFWPRMNKGGVILIHDYFNAPGIIEEDRYLGIKAAAMEFCKEVGTVFIPIGDEMSIAFIKQ